MPAFCEDKGAGNYRGTFKIYERTAIRLEKVNNNEVRLWNRTGETLEMTLTANQ